MFWLQTKQARTEFVYYFLWVRKSRLHMVIYLSSIKTKLQKRAKNTETVHDFSLMWVLHFRTNSSYNHWSALHRKTDLFCTLRFMILWMQTLCRFKIQHVHQTTLAFSAVTNTSKHPWLDIAFMSSTETYAIGYNAQRCKPCVKRNVTQQININVMLLFPISLQP